MITACRLDVRHCAHCITDSWQELTSTRVTDGQTNGGADGQNYDSQDRASTAASRGKKLQGHTFISHTGKVYRTTALNNSLTFEGPAICGKWIIFMCCVELQNSFIFHKRLQAIQQRYQRVCQRGHFDQSIRADTRLRLVWILRYVNYPS